jgi:hypothetical protein
VSVLLTNQHAGLSTEVAATSASDTRIEAQLPNDPTAVRAGVWTAAAVIRQSGQPDWTTNEVPFGLAPEVIGLPITVARGGGGLAVIDLDCRPAVGPNQACSLLLGAMSIPANAPRPEPETTVRFVVPDANPGDYPARMRVDAVDSLLVDATTSPPSYDASQTITIT